MHGRSLEAAALQYKDTYYKITKITISVMLTNDIDITKIRISMILVKRKNQTESQSIFCNCRVQHLYMSSNLNMQLSNERKLPTPP